MCKTHKSFVNVYTFLDIFSWFFLRHTELYFVQVRYGSVERERGGAGARASEATMYVYGCVRG